MSSPVTSNKLTCYHCGDHCLDDSIRAGDKVFCCEGCELVHELLSENNLCTYYQLDQHPGNKPGESSSSARFAWLDDEDAVKQLLIFSEKANAAVRFSIPKIHCVSCIWLLEHLHKIEKGISSVRTDFLSKEVTITFNRNEISLRKIVETLSRIGYEPEIRFSDLQKKIASKTDRLLIYKIGIAGFCFGNIMMLSFPEYLTGVSHIEPVLRHFFSYLNLILALPVFFYSAGDYFINSWKAARQKYFSIDLPIAFGLAAMLIRSSYEIISGTGSGYFDSMTGLVFFLLLGRYFQALTYKSMSFERDYQSYFPVAVTVKKNGEEISTSINNIVPGDKIIIHHEELIPADAVLLNGDAHIDYSFVTGESNPVSKKCGELIYAGGKQQGSRIELSVQKTVEQSYLTQLWNHESFKKTDTANMSALADRISKYFTIAIIFVAVGTGIYWLPKDIHRAIMACTSILIIACPCALAITVPFTFGNIIRLLGRYHFYLKNSSVVEAIAKTDTLVFDKTGTITLQKNNRIEFKGEKLSDYQLELIQLISAQSLHPKSRLIHSFIISGSTDDTSGLLPVVKEFREIPGEGIEGIIEDTRIRLGSKKFVTQIPNPEMAESLNYSRVYVSFNDECAGFFRIYNAMREGLHEEVFNLKKDFELFLLSGDNESDRMVMQTIFPKKENLFFEQSPDDKLKFVESLQQQGKKVMMIGDGLNDAGALRQSDAGIAVSEDLLQFSPACDAILKGSDFNRLHRYIQFCRSGIHIIWFTFSISLLYNLVGISFAVRGELSPMVAAILMPVSSISVILITTIATKWKAARLKK